MSEFVEVGHAIIPCPRCDAPRHVPVEVVCRPIAGPDTTSMKAMLNGVEVGRIHLAVRHKPGPHQCSTEPQPTKLHIVEVGPTSAE